MEPFDNCLEESDKTSSSRTFLNVFEVPRDPFSATNLEVTDLKEFLYQWYSKNLGTVAKNGETRIHTWMWTISVGDKSVSDKILDAKSIMRLSEMVANEEELKVMRSQKPDASRDDSYEAWEMNMRRTAKTVSSLVGDYLQSKEIKVGNLKKSTVGALARRWKNMKYLIPTEADMTEIRSGQKYQAKPSFSRSATSHSTNNTSSSSSSSSNKSSSSSSTDK